MHITFLFVSAFLVAWSYWSLLSRLKKGESQPIATRVALCCASMLNFASVVFGEHAWGDVVFGGMNAALSAIVVKRSWQHRDTNVSYIDYACLILSVAGAVTFACYRQSDYGVAFAICGDFVGFFPAFREIALRPRTQPVATYFIGFGAAVVAIAADAWQGSLSTNSLFTVYLMIIDLLLPVGTLCMRAVYRTRAQPTPEEALQNV